MSSEKYLATLAKLLRHAENPGATEDEAANYMAKAQELATTHSIDLEVARQHQAQREARSTPISKQIALGERGKRGLHTYVGLFSGIARANDVKLDVAHNSTYVIAYGFESDIEVVEALYGSLVFQMVQACKTYMNTGAYKQEESDEEVYNYRTGQWKTRAVSGITARLNFQKNFASRVEHRLAMARHEAVKAKKAEQSEAERVDVSTGTELVLKAKGVEVHDFYKKTTKARGSYKGGRNMSYSASASAAGRRAGDSARLSGVKGIGGSRTALSS